MSERRRAQDADQESELSGGVSADEDAAGKLAFIRGLLFTLAFVAAPAVVMLALGERAIAAAWFIVGATIVFLDVRRDLASFWRWLRSGSRDRPE